MFVQSMHGSLIYSKCENSPYTEKKRRYSVAHHYHFNGYSISEVVVDEQNYIGTTMAFPIADFGLYIYRESTIRTNYFNEYMYMKKLVDEGITER